MVVSSVDLRASMALCPETKGLLINAAPECSVKDLFRGPLFSKAGCAHLYKPAKSPELYPKLAASPAGLATSFEILNDISRPQSLRNLLGISRRASILPRMREHSWSLWQINDLLLRHAAGESGIKLTLDTYGNYFHTIGNDGLLYEIRVFNNGNGWGVHLTPFAEAFEHKRENVAVPLYCDGHERDRIFWRV